MVKRLLIVEDNPGWADLLGRHAVAIGAQTRIAVSPGQALELIDEWHPHAVCLDMLLAGETGIALLQEMKSHDDLAGLPVVICSNVSLAAEDVASFGVKFVLDKGTMTPTTIREAFRRALGYEPE